jgi:hypothetical protein
MFAGLRKIIYICRPLEKRKRNEKRYSSRKLPSRSVQRHVKRVFVLEQVNYEQQRNHQMGRWQ